MTKSTIKLSASMMCANFGCLEKEISNLESGGIDSYHLDIMDGQFVDNFGMGFQDMAFIRGATKKPMEAHLMINDPERYLSILSQLNLDVAYIHPESTHVPELVIEEIKKLGIKPGIVLNPGTSISRAEELFNIVDRVLVMCVVPGHAGRTYAGYVTKKIDKLLALKQEYSFEIFLDGACTHERILDFAAKGVTGFILGTSVLFGKNKPYQEILQDLRADLSKTSDKAE